MKLSHGTSIADTAAAPAPMEWTWAREIATRAGACGLGLVMLLLMARFFSQWDTLRPFTVPMALLFFLFGWIRPSLGLYPLIFFLPLVPIIPHVHGVANFSLIEIGWWALCIGCLARRTMAPRTLRLPAPPPWPLLTLLTLVICGTALARLLMDFLWSDSVIHRILWSELGDFFRWRQESRLFPLRAAVVWLEGIAFVTLVRRNAVSDAFQRRVRVLLIISLALVVAVSLHHFAMGLTLGEDAPRILSDWQIDPDWLPERLTSALPGLKRIHGPWPDSNSFASYLLMGFSLVLSTAVLSRSVFARAALLILGVATVLVLLLTFSRIAWIWFPVTLLAWSKLGRARARRLWAQMEGGGRRWVLLAFALLLGSVGLITIGGRAQSAIDAAVASRPGERVNVLLKGRLTLWQTGLRMAHLHPLLGSGWGSFYERSFLLHRPEAGVTSWGEEVWNPDQENAHNQYLQILAESGLLGVALIGLLMGQWFRMALHTLAWGRGEHRWAVRGLVSAVVGLSGTLLTGHALLLTEMLFFFWVIIGLAFVPTRQRGRPAPPASPLRWSGGAQVAIWALMVVLGVRLWIVRDAPEMRPYFTGLYHIEEESPVFPTYRWTRDRATVVVRNDDGECSFMLSNARENRQPVPVEIFINGELRDRVVIPDHHWWPHRYALDLPENRIYRLELRVLNTYTNPSDPPDRILGIRYFGPGTEPGSWPRV